MNGITIVLLVLICVGVPLLGSVLKKSRAGSEKYQQILTDFEQRVNALLEADEIVEGLCGYKPCAAVTNKRLLVDTKAGIDSVAFQQIKKVKGMDSGANKTRDPERMLLLEIKAEKKYVIGNHSEGFATFVNALMRRVSL